MKRIRNFVGRMMFVGVSFLALAMGPETSRAQTVRADAVFAEAARAESARDDAGLEESARDEAGLEEPLLIGDTWTEPFRGVRHLHRVTTNPNQNIHALAIDLCESGISFRATKYEERGQTTSAFGASMRAQAAINGDFFVSGFGLERGFAIGGGALWPAGKPDDASTGQLAIGAHRLEILRDLGIRKPEAWMTDVVGGRPTVLVDGTIPDTSGHAVLCQRNPRTAVGLTKDGSTLLVAVVDGRATSRVGMTCNELGELMLRLGADDALNLDGGGSATMWLQGQGVLNYPTDGRERKVANHLAIFARGDGPASACPRVYREDADGLSLRTPPNLVAP
ncbi:phosphodiester glycosidase family protein [Pendulispora albinea]|uniref:Phosphodiester glycosidase family protein n=1 Tax=Pendulispora albinea TaxID=2741071 RepID=A0ABZ2M6P1_9BACT